MADIEFVPGQLFMLAQFVSCIEDEVDVFYCYAKLLQHIGIFYSYFEKNNVFKMLHKKKKTQMVFSDRKL